MRFDRLAGARRAPRDRMPVSRSRWLAAGAALLTLSWSLTVSAAVCYVNGAASGTSSGASWTNAYTDLQSALTNAGCTEVWVAQGSHPYKPSSGDQTISFNIGPNVAVYGGFVGGEISRDERDPVAHVTILSGDIDNNDTGTNGVDADTSKIVGSNSRHIVVMNGTAGTSITATTVLDGFTLTGGDNTNTSPPNEGGGALWCRGSGAGHACSPTLSQLVLSGNRAGYGGAVMLDGDTGGASNPTLTNITFSGNAATGIFGGALISFGEGGTSSPVLTNVTFSGNGGANYGGAMANDGTGGGISSPTLTNVTFSGNNAVTYGGAVFNAGSSGTCYPKFVNATFNGNSASYGGAIYNLGTYDPLLLNSILWGDSAANGPEIFNSNGTASLSYSIVQGGCSTECGGTNISTSDPDLGALTDNGGFTPTMMPGSAAINQVPCSYSTEEPVFDARGAVRPDSASTGPNRCDMGAVEANSLPGDLIFADRFGSSPWDDF